MTQIRRRDPRNIQMIGARKIKIIVFVHPEAITAANHPFARALPRYHHRRA